MIMAHPGAVAPVVFGGKIRAVMAYLDRQKMQARGPLAADVMNALDAANVFLPSGDAKFGDLDYVIDSNSMYEKIEDMGDIPLRYENGQRDLPPATLPRPRMPTTSRPMSCGSTANARYTSPSIRQLGSSTLRRRQQRSSGSLKDMEEQLTRCGINLKLVMDQSVYVRNSIEALVQEGVLGALLCSLVILMFLGEMRMTAIAIMTLPISCLACCRRAFISRADDQRDDSGRNDPGDRADDR